MAEFSTCYPDIDLRIESLPPKVSPEHTSGDVLVMLTGKQTDFPAVKKLFPVRYVPACSATNHDQLSKQGHCALEQATLLVHKARPQAWDLWARASGLAEPAPKQIIRLDSMYALARATEQGVGIGLIPMPVSTNWFTSGALSRLFDTDLVMRDHYCVATSGNSRYPEATRLLWEWIVASFGQQA
jgi:LysR family glycine cleavage system transcriptional activator